MANADLHRIIADSQHARWIDDLKIKRHPAAHREPIYLSTVIVPSKEKPIGDTLVISDKDSRVVIYDALNHLDYDMGEFHKLMGAICELFGV